MPITRQPPTDQPPGHGNAQGRTFSLDVPLQLLRQETVGGILLLLGAAAALVWANSPWSGTYDQVRDFGLGPLTVEAWTSDGLLAIFFLVAGLELKRELVTGSLREPARAAVPVVAALTGMLVPALLFLAVTGASGDRAAMGGWAIPTATDIAFALAVLAVAGRGLPSAVRVFLLTLTVVDDLGAIVIIAIAFSGSLHWWALGGAVLLLAAYGWLQHRRVDAWYLTVPVVIGTWWLVHESGVHATIAGVAVGLLTRARHNDRKHDDREAESPAERLEHRLRPLSAAVAVPLFALFAAGVPVSGGALARAATDPAAIGVVVGLVGGKVIGVAGGSWLVTRLTRAELDPELGWSHVLIASLLAGVGLTVALLVADLAFGSDPGRVERVKTAVLAASCLAALLSVAALRWSTAGPAIRVRRGMAQDHGG